ncbi:MAG TPA: branched-chain amino acid ABC transporter permease [Burkholderiales bacterium]|jgi:branched-chain amino acid transport system permease protein|nr:branched-chain amino acid ABC transporter permease [Burkholderiales bacterium]
MLITSALISGLGLGSMYGLLALGFYITYAVSSTVNFSQGSSMMLGAVLAFAFNVTWGWPLPLAVLAALVICAVYGIVVELIAIRPFVRRKSEAWLMSTVALGLVVDNLVLFTFGKEPRGFSLPFANASMQIGGVGVSPLQIAIPVVGLLLAALLHFFSQKTRLGKAMLAVVQNRDAASLMGINVSLAVLLAYAASTVFAGAAGIMIAPLFNVQASMGTVFGLKAFAVAILGGINNAWGVMVAGLLFGVTEALITSLLGSAYTQILTFGLVIVALAFMPNGLFGRAGVKKV